jgi:hypothetical protein
MSDEEANWLNDLKPGDEVVVHPPGHYGSMTIQKVDRRLPSGRLVVGQMTFDPDGWQRGGVNYGRFGRQRAHLSQTTQEIRDKIEHAELVDALKATEWRMMPLDVLRAAFKVVHVDRTEPATVRENDTMSC